MATRKRKDPAQHWIVRFLPIQTLYEAQNLVRRFQEGKAFRGYVVNRLWLVIPVGLLIFLIGIACAAAIVVFFAGAHPLLALPAIVLVPVILIGSLLVQAYVFLSWLESRAIARALGNRGKPVRGARAPWLSRKLGVDMGKLPPVPWVLAAVVVFAPMAMLASFALNIALVLIVLAILAPIIYAFFDR
ncbi:MAG: hypothetical protein ACREUQ_01950 [Burkholderiales bacterium]